MNYTNFVEKSLTGKSLLLKSHGKLVRSLHHHDQSSHLFLLFGLYVEVLFSTHDMQIVSIQVLDQEDAFDRYLYGIDLLELF
jgi:hypothetical protein